MNSFVFSYVIIFSLCIFSCNEFNEFTQPNYQNKVNQPPTPCIRANPCTDSWRTNPKHEPCRTKYKKRKRIEMQPRQFHILSRAPTGDKHCDKMKNRINRAILGLENKLKPITKKKHELKKVIAGIETKLYPAFTLRKRKGEAQDELSSVIKKQHGPKHSRKINQYDLTSLSASLRELVESSDRDGTKLALSVITRGILRQLGADRENHPELISNAREILIILASDRNTNQPALSSRTRKAPPKLRFNRKNLLNLENYIKMAFVWKLKIQDELNPLVKKETELRMKLSGLDEELSGLDEELLEEKLQYLNYFTALLERRIEGTIGLIINQSHELLKSFYVNHSQVYYEVYEELQTLNRVNTERIVSIKEIYTEMHKNWDGYTQDIQKRMGEDDDSHILENYFPDSQLNQFKANLDSMQEYIKEIYGILEKSHHCPLLDLERNLLELRFLAEEETSNFPELTSKMKLVEKTIKETESILRSHNVQDLINYNYNFRLSEATDRLISAKDYLLTKILGLKPEACSL